MECTACPSMQAMSVFGRVRTGRHSKPKAAKRPYCYHLARSVRLFAHKAGPAESWNARVADPCPPEATSIRQKECRKQQDHCASVCARTLDFPTSPQPAMTGRFFQIVGNVLILRTNSRGKVPLRTSLPCAIRERLEKFARLNTQLQPVSPSRNFSEAHYFATQTK